METMARRAHPYSGLQGIASCPEQPVFLLRDSAGIPLAAMDGQERYWRQWFEAAGQTMPKNCTLSHHEQHALALDFALAGNAVALADLPLIRNELANGSLVRLSETCITLDRCIHLAVPEGPFRDPRLTAFWECLRGRAVRLSGTAAQPCSVAAGDQSAGHAYPNARQGERPGK